MMQVNLIGSLMLYVVVSAWIRKRRSKGETATEIDISSQTDHEAYIVLVFN